MEAHPRQMEVPLFLVHPLPSSSSSHYITIKVIVCIFRPRLLDFVSSLDESLVKSASQKAFQSLPDISKAVSELTVLKGVGPATASAILAAFAPHITPFMSDEVSPSTLLFFPFPISLRFLFPRFTFSCGHRLWR